MKILGLVSVLFSLSAFASSSCWHLEQSKFNPDIDITVSVKKTEWAINVSQTWPELGISAGDYKCGKPDRTGCMYGCGAHIYCSHQDNPATTIKVFSRFNTEEWEQAAEWYKRYSFLSPSDEFVIYNLIDINNGINAFSGFSRAKPGVHYVTAEEEDKVVSGFASSKITVTPGNCH